MPRRSVRLALTALAAVTVAHVAAAAPPEAPCDPTEVEQPERTDAVALRVGGFLPQAPSLGTGGAGLDVELAVSRRFGDLLELEAAVGLVSYQSGQMRSTFPDSFDAAGDVVYRRATVHQDLLLVPLTVTARLPLADGPLVPYLLGGVGLDLARLDRIDSAGTRYRITNQVVGTLAGLGASYQLKERLYLTAEARMAWARMRIFDQSIGLDALRLSAGVGWRF